MVRYEVEPVLKSMVGVEASRKPYVDYAAGDWMAVLHEMIGKLRDRDYMDRAAGLTKTALLDVVLDLEMGRPRPALEGPAPPRKRRPRVAAAPPEEPAEAAAAPQEPVAVKGTVFRTLRQPAAGELEWEVC